MWSIPELIEQGLAHQRRGEWDAAEASYRQALATGSVVPDALHLLGLVEAGRGNLEQAADWIRQAVAANDRTPPYWNNLGLVEARRERWTEAIAHYRRSLELAPGQAGTLAKLGRALQRVGRTGAALSALGEACQREPSHSDHWNAKGAVLAEVGRDEEALAAFNEALRLDPAHSEAWANRAHLDARGGRWEQAQEGYRQALRYDPGLEQARQGLKGVLIQYGDAAYREQDWGRAAAAFEELVLLAPGEADSHYRLAWVRTAQKRLQEARTGYEQAIALQPDMAEAWNNLGHVHTGLGDLELALNCYRRALLIRPEYADAHYNVGVTLQGLERWDEADLSYLNVLAINPKHADAHNNRGGVSLARRSLEEAIRHYDQALEIQPGHHEARWNRALAQLTLGDFKQGWAGYETRLERKSFLQKEFRAPRWRGEPLSGKAILVWAEQGLGDTIQFVRYLTLLEEQGARVLLEVHPRLQPLFPGSYAAGEVPEHYDYYIPLLSLPYHFGTLEATIPDVWKGLTVSSERRKRWRTKIAGPGLAVGLVWRGNPENWKGRKRSVPANVMLNLGPLAEVRFFSLQWGPEAAALEGYPYVQPLEDESTSLKDTAAMVSELDLVITVDTMMAHLAGTLGKPVWVLLHTESDWRWMLDRENSPWYPSMRLFRQQRGEGWAEVAGRVRSALAGEVRGRGGAG